MSHRLLAALLGAACTEAAPPPADAAVLTVAFSMDVHGELEPCG